MPFGLFFLLFVLEKGQGPCSEPLGRPGCSKVQSTACQHCLWTTFLGPSPRERPRHSLTPRDPASDACNTSFLQVSPKNTGRASDTCQFLFSQRLHNTQFYPSFPALQQPLISLTHLNVNNAQVTQCSAGNPHLCCGC